MNTKNLKVFLLVLFCFTVTPALPQQQTSEDIVINFQGTPLKDVLDYLSKTAGLKVVPMADITGIVDLISYSPLTTEEIIDLLNFSLSGQGLTAIKDDDLLKIVNLSEAILHKLPVYLMDSPEDIPNNETWATWVIPLNFIQANGMVGDLGEFVPDFANIMVNDSGNSLVITDAQTRTRKIAEIVWLLEGAVIDSTVSEFFKINYAYAEDVSLLIQDLFGGGTSQNRNRNRQNNRNSSNNQGQVSAVADYRTNTLIISAPFEIMENIREVIDQVDEPVEETSIIKYFPLRYAGAEETASLILSLFNTTQNNTGFGFDIQFGGSSNNYSERSVRDEQVYALADTRVNAVIVKAAESIMPEIEATINSLDSDSSGDQKIFVYDVGAWSVEEVAEMLNQIFSGNGQGGSTARATGQTNRQRQTSGQRGGGIGR